MSAQGGLKREFHLGGTAAGKTAAASAHASADEHAKSANRGAVRSSAKGAT